MITESVTQVKNVDLTVYALHFQHFPEKSNSVIYELLNASDLNYNVYSIKHDTKSSDNKLHYLFRSRIGRFLLLIQII